MPTSSEAEQGLDIRKRMIGLLLALGGLLLCLVRLYLSRHKFSETFGIDFRAVYGSCRCVISGCNPYYFADMKDQFLKQGGTIAEAMTSSYGPFQPYYVGYPPPTLFYLIPFALLHWPFAFAVYMVIAISLYVIAVILFSDLCSDYNSITANACLGLFLAVQGKIFILGQPTLVAAALLCIAVWCLIRNRFPWFGVITFSLSLILKPPLGGLFLLYFLVATPSYRRRAWQVIGLAAVLCAPALLWFATHANTRNWVQYLRTNLMGISAPGNLSDPGPQHVLENSIIDLQVIVSLYRDQPSFYNHVVWAISAVVLAIWLYPVIRRRPGLEKDIICITTIAAFSMLPIYHRVYDSRALLILFPAVALLNQRTLWWGRAATAATVLLSLVLSDSYTSNTNVVSPLVRRFAGHHLMQIALVHPAPLILLGITMFYLAVLYVVPASPALGLEIAS